MNKKTIGEVIYWGLIVVVGGLFWILIRVTAKLIDNIESLKKNYKKDKK